MGLFFNRSELYIPSVQLSVLIMFIPPLHFFLAVEINKLTSPLLAHPLRLLSTHHILRETAPDTFALTRVASLLDSGKSVASVFAK